MKFLVPLLIFGFMIWLMVKIGKFLSFWKGILENTAAKPQVSPKTPVRPAPKRPAPVKSEQDKSLERTIDRAFEKMGLGIAFGHLNSEAKKMLKKAWAIRTPVTPEENAPAEGQDMEASSEHTLAREYAPEQVPLSDNISHFAFRTSHSPLQQWVVQNEIFSPPLALREER